MAFDKFEKMFGRIDDFIMSQFIFMTAPRSLVVYYSYDNNTKLIAETIANVIGAQIVRIKPQNEMSSTGLFKIMRGIYQIVRKHRPELCPLGVNPQDFDTIFVGTPVWGGSLTPAVHKFLESNRFSNKKIGLFCAHGDNYGEVFNEMKGYLDGNTIIGEKNFSKVLENPEIRKHEATEWVNQVLALLRE